ncbi:zinc-dependent alcohol dehydrogenase family protein [Roseiconus nitratireducens]|uniref:alcohol dehydrogenase n=2 Tax=Roseiconus nitratireducens TaxID=2605748 RepID=A0A5M6DIF7_9BACT|nr:zinc-dependent alcohol dehydrogenase family protein [Roseiconus nitratireducens]
MRAMRLEKTGSLAECEQPLRLVDLPIPEPREGEILLRVTACGVCHTELDEIEGRLPCKLPVVPGHEVVGRVETLGPGVNRFAAGDRAGVGWIHHSCGGAQENLSPEFTATGCDVDGGYAEYMTVPAAYAVPIPAALGDVESAPLMCAGAIGYRALSLTGLHDGAPLGLMGFGGSGHLVLQLCKHQYPNSPVYVFTRGEEVQAFATELGADWSGGISSSPPQPLAAIIDTTPVWKPVVQSLEKLAPGGRLVINAIRKEAGDQSELMQLSYHKHLWMEREIKSVANLTHHDIAAFLPLAAEIPIHPTTQTYPLEQANRALCDLRNGNVRGAKVLEI